MAYITSERVAEIRKELKNKFPSWKLSVTRQHYSVVKVVILKSDIDLTHLLHGHKYLRTDVFNVGDTFGTPEATAALQGIHTITNKDNYNNSDSQSDYFDVGFYVTISIGDFEKPYVFIPPATPALQHFLVDEYDNTIATFNTYDSEAIKAGIVAHLTAHPQGCVTHEKTQTDKKYAGNEMLNYYEINPKNSKPSKVCYSGGGKITGYKALTVDAPPAAVEPGNIVPVYSDADLKAAGFEVTLTCTEGTPTYGANCEHAAQYNVTLQSLRYFHIGGNVWRLCLTVDKVSGYTEQHDKPATVRI